MWKLNFYLARTVLLSVLAVIGVLLGIDIVFTFIAQMGQVGQGSFTVLTAIEFTLLRLPSDLYLILPVCGFLGVLFGLGQLASKSELVAMRAAGVSIYQIAFGVVIGAVFYVILGFALSMYISPATRHAAYFKADIANQGQTVLVLANETWVKSGNHFVYIGQTRPDGKLFNVNDYYIKDNKLESITHAPMVQVKQKEWVLYDPLITTFSDNEVKAVRLPDLTQPSLVTPKLLRILTLNPQNMTVAALSDYIHYRIKNKLDAQPYELQLWLRFFQPVTVLILMLLAIPFVFGPMRSSSVGIRLVTGFVIGFAFYVINQFFGSFSLIYNFTPFWGAALPTILFTILLIILLWRMN